MTRLSMWLCAGLIAGGIACGTSEPDYVNLSNEALEQAGLADVNASYDREARVVHLTGTAGSQAARLRAAEAVRGAVGEGVQIANEVTVEGGETEMADDLDSGLSTRLENLRETDVTLQDEDVTFDVNNGVVTITGRVPTDAEKARVAELVSGQPGVREVVNSLEVGPPPTD